MEFKVPAKHRIKHVNAYQFTLGGCLYIVDCLVPQTYQILRAPQHVLLLPPTLETSVR